MRKTLSESIGVGFEKVKIRTRVDEVREPFTSQFVLFDCLRRLSTSVDLLLSSDVASSASSPGDTATMAGVL